jgi:hypothetical protein
MTTRSENLSQKARYRNSFYNPSHGHDPEFYETDAKPVEYQGCLLYQRIKGCCWDVVKDGVCIGQYGGRSGAEAFIDRGCKRLGFE